jgi:ElaB/YqjD/DUF883 family membrane-anchored ribosome-binding protein
VDNELEVIRHQMEEKRASLADKLDALEDQVLETVHEAATAMTSTVRDVTGVVDSVKDNIHETVESIKETFNLSDRIRRHPWASVAGAFASGFAGAFLLSRSSRQQEPPQPTPPRRETNGFAHGPVRAPVTDQQPAASSSEQTSPLGIAVTEALNTIKGMAVGTLLGVLNEVVGDAVPASMKPEVEQLFGDLNTRLGGKALHKLVFPSGASNESEPSKGGTHEPGKQAEVGRTLGSAQRQGQEPVGQPDRRRADQGRRGLRAHDRSAQGAHGKEP